MEEERKVRVERCNIGDEFIMYKFYPEVQQVVVMKKKLKHTFVLDNSSSMRHYSREALVKIGCQLFDMKCTLPGIVIAFDTHTTVYKNISNSKDVASIELPRQNATDITTAILVAVAEISRETDMSIHHVLTFLSDGQHNSGPSLVNFEELKQKLGSDRKLSIIVVGIAQCDTSLGMRIKTNLETVAIPGLESIYFAKSHSEEFDLVAAQLLSSMEAFFVGGMQHDICFAQCEDAFFLDSHSAHTSLFLRDKPQVVIAKRTTLKQQCDVSLPILMYDNLPLSEMHYIHKTTLEPKDIETFFDTIVPRLSQLKIANNGNMQILNPQLLVLETLLQCAEQVIMAFKNAHTQEVKAVEFKSDCDEEYKKVSTSTRLRLVRKKWKGAEMMFQSEKSRLEQLRATIQNDSSSQAAYLIGMNKKYAAKAVVRAGTINVSAQQILSNLISNVIPKLQTSFEIPTIFAQQDNIPMSILSCNTASEQLQDWITTTKNPDLQFDDIYSLLVAFGFLGYPIEFLLNNSVQMDPFQSKCLHIETVPIDTCTLMFAQRMNHKLLSPNSQKPMSNCLILVDCVCPQASLIAMRSEVYQFLLSCSLCNDLYMYNGQMTFAAHAHALLGCMQKYQKCRENSGEEFVSLAVKIVYSIRLFWSTFDNAENKGLFAHWFDDWSGITQLATDKCNHPVQLPLLLAALDSETKTDDTASENDISVPLLNLCNEVLARNFKGYLLSKTEERKTASDAAPNLKKIAIKLLQKLFGITSENSPKPLDDILSDEPTIESIRESCQNYADFNNELFEEEFEKPFCDAMQHLLSPYILAFFFAQEIRTFGICSLQKQMEICGDVPAPISKSFHAKLSSFKTLNINQLFTPKTLVTMFAQSMMCHDNASRASIVEYDTQHPATLQDIIIDLRLAHYLSACKIKSSEYQKIIGNVTLTEGLKAGSVEFDAMLGSHSHGLGKQQFWALHSVAEKDVEKQRLFIAKSNGTVSFKQ